MKTRLLWIAIIGLAITSLYFGIVRPDVSSIPKHIRDPIAEMKPPMPPPIALPTLEVPPIPTLEPPPLKTVPFIEPVLKGSETVKAVRPDEKK